MPDRCIEIIEEVAIAGGPFKRHRSRAGVQLLPDSSLFAAYRVGWDMFQPSCPHGGIVTTRSIDGGHTWDEPVPIIAEPSWDWFGAQRLQQLSDGTLLMFLGKARWGTEAFHSYCIQSEDGGRHWSEIGPEIKLLGAWTEPYGHGIAHELVDGSLMLGFQGSDALDAPSILVVAFSRDRGMTWSDPVTIASEPGLSFREAELLRLRDGRFLAMMRTDESPCESYQSHSSDSGRTWTPISKTGFYGHTLCLFQLRQAIVCLYRDMDPSRPGIGYSTSYNDGETWHYGGQLYEAPIQSSGWASACGYPSLVRLSAAEVFCIYHTSFIDGNSEVRGLFLRDMT